MARYVMPIIMDDVKKFSMRFEVDKLKEDFEKYKDKARKSKWKSARRGGK